MGVQLLPKLAVGARHTLAVTAYLLVTLGVGSQGSWAQDDGFPAVADDADGGDSAAEPSIDRSTASAVEGVTLSTSVSSVRSGETITIRLENAREEAMYLFGCRPVQPEWFAQDRWQNLPGEQCKSEGTARKLDPGAAEFKLPVTGRTRMLFRAAVTFGVGCIDNVPLSAAHCRDFGTVVTDTIRVTPPE